MATTAHHASSLSTPRQLLEPIHYCLHTLIAATRHIPCLQPRCHFTLSDCRDPNHYFPTTEIIPTLLPTATADLSVDTWDTSHILTLRGRFFSTRQISINVTLRKMGWICKSLPLTYLVVTPTNRVLSATLHVLSHECYEAVVSLVLNGVDPILSLLPRSCIDLQVPCACCRISQSPDEHSQPSDRPNITV